MSAPARRRLPGLAARGGLLLLAALVLTVAATHGGVVRAAWSAASVTGAGQLATLTVQAPAATSAQTAAAGGVQVGWNASPTAGVRPVGYLLFRRPTGSGPWTQVTASAVGALVYTDVPPSDGSWDYAVETSVSSFTSPLSNVVSGLSDRTPPTVAVTCNGTTCGSGWSRSAVTVTLTASDGGSGVASVTRTLDGTSTTTSGSSVTFTVTGDAAHTLSYYATDVAGNAGTPQAITVRVDGNPPAISGWALCDQDGAPVLPTSPDWLRSGGKYIVYAQVTDPASGVATVSADVGGGGAGAFVTGLALSAGSGTCAGVTYNYSSAVQTALGGLTAGSTVYVDVIAADVAGNTGHLNAAHSPNVGVDNTAPSASTVSDTRGAAGSGSFTVSWTASVDSGGSGLAGYQVVVYDLTTNTTVQTYAAGVSTFSHTFTALVSGRSYALAVEATDNAGNQQVAYVIDTAP